MSGKILRPPTSAGKERSAPKDLIMIYSPDSKKSGFFISGK